MVQEGHKNFKNPVLVAEARLPATPDHSQGRYQLVPKTVVPAGGNSKFLKIILKIWSGFLLG